MLDSDMSRLKNFKLRYYPRAPCLVAACNINFRLLPDSLCPKKSNRKSRMSYDSSNQS